MPGRAKLERGAGPSLSEDAAVQLVSLNSTALRGELLDDISGVFGGGAFLTLDDASGATAGKVLRDALGSNLARVVDLFREMDENGDGNIGKVEFRRALARIVDNPPTREDSDALFDEIDTDHGGTIEYKELHRLLRRRTSDRGPKKALWAPRQPRTKHTDTTADGEADGDMVKEEDSTDARAQSPIPPHGAKYAALSYARSEAVLLGQLVTCSAPAEALSRRRVVALNELTEEIDRTAIRHMEKLEALHRKETLAAGRLRGQRCKSAKARQARAIASTGSFVARSMHKRPLTGVPRHGDDAMETSATYTAAPRMPTGHR